MIIWDDFFYLCFYLFNSIYFNYHFTTPQMDLAGHSCLSVEVVALLAHRQLRASFVGPFALASCQERAWERPSLVAFVAVASLAAKRYVCENLVEYESVLAWLMFLLEKFNTDPTPKEEKQVYEKVFNGLNYKEKNIKL